MIKINLDKFKNLTSQVSFFWQTLIVIFFTGLIIVLILSTIFWLKLESSLTTVLLAGETSASETLNTKSLNNILTKIKTRSADLASTTANLPTVTDPAR
ncbi:MAG: hypothetical protein WC531_03440 [Candidatus Paceibacterota bacterium]|jgi:uncharacterized membrane protein YciS (DUF1049 family)